MFRGPRHAWSARSLLAVLAALLIPAAHGQTSINTSLSLSADPATVFEGQSTTLTATLAVSSGPVSATDGLLVFFQGSPTSPTGAGVPLKNGVAQVTFTPRCGGAHGCDNILFATFSPQGNFDPSQASTDVFVDIPGSQLLGSYAFRFSGQSSLGGTKSELAIVGSMVADGNGHLSGVEDVNYGAGVLSSLKFTGTYSLDISNVGVMTITSSQGTQTYSLALPAAAINGISNDATFLETDGVVQGNGVLRRQDAYGISYALNTPGSNYGQGTYGIDGAGSTACTDCGAFGHPAGPVSAAGLLTLGAAGALTGSVQESIGPLVGPVTPVSGTASPFDQTGRMFFAVAATPTSRDQPARFVAYLIDGSNFFYLSTDPHTENILLSGTAAQKP